MHPNQAAPTERWRLPTVDLPALGRGITFAFLVAPPGLPHSPGVTVDAYTVVVRDPSLAGRTDVVLQALRAELTRAGLPAVSAGGALAVDGGLSAAGLQAFGQVLIAFAERSPKRTIEIDDGTASVVIEGPVPRFCLPAVNEFLYGAALDQMPLY